MRALIAVAVVVMGCGPARYSGAPVEGGACDSTSECSSAATISICESGKWADYDCPSACGNSQKVLCDWSQAKVGDVCPASFTEGGAVACSASGDAVIVCRRGTFAEMACPRCQENGFGITCN